MFLEQEIVGSARLFGTRDKTDSRPTPGDD